MRRRWFAAALALAVATSQPALACIMYSPLELEDVQYADVVVVGRISDYRIIRDEAFRERMLRSPSLSPELRRWYQNGQSLLSDYARFEIQVDEVLVGSAPNRLSVTWDNSTFGEPEHMAGGRYLIALRQPSSPAPPLRGPSATVLRNAEPNLYTLVQAPCSSAFLFEEESSQANGVREILNARQ